MIILHTIYAQNLKGTKTLKHPHDPLILHFILVKFHPHLYIGHQTKTFTQKRGSNQISSKCENINESTAFNALQQIG